MRQKLDFEKIFREYRETMKSLAAIERKERILEQWNKPSECCIHCKYYDWGHGCSQHIFPISDDERTTHTCKDHVYETIGLDD